jgi:hypothetical protein
MKEVIEKVGDIESLACDALRCAFGGLTTHTLTNTLFLNLVFVFYTPRIARRQ